MKVLFNYSKLPVSKSLEDLTEKKLTKLAKYFRGEVKVDVNFKLEGKSHTMDLHLFGNSKEYDTTATSNDMYRNIDTCVDKIKAQVIKSKMEYRSDSRKRRIQVKFKNDYMQERLES